MFVVFNGLVFNGLKFWYGVCLLVFTLTHWLRLKVYKK